MIGDTLATDAFPGAGIVGAVTFFKVFFPITFHVSLPLLKTDGVVKSPIYCVAVIFQNLNILQVCQTILKNHYALYMEPFTTPSTDKFVTFYWTIKTDDGVF